MSVCYMEGKSISTDMLSPCRNGCREYLNSCLPSVVCGAWLVGECMEQSYCEWCSYSDECGLD